MKIIVDMNLPPELCGALRAHGWFRTQDVLSRKFQLLLISALQQFESVLEDGAIVVVDATRAKARVLPLTK